MVALSATFRAQCRRIGDAPSLRVVIRIDPALVDRSYRAQTRFARAPSGDIFARVHVSLRLNPVDWIAHEFEHVIEQLDGAACRRSRPAKVLREDVRDVREPLLRVSSRGAGLKFVD